MVCHFHDVIRSMYVGSMSLYGRGSAGRGAALGGSWASAERTWLFITEFAMLWVAKENNFRCKYRSIGARAVFLDNSEAEFRLRLRQGHRENTRTGILGDWYWGKTRLLITHQKGKDKPNTLLGQKLQGL